MDVLCEAQGPIAANCYMVASKSAVLVIDPFYLSNKLKAFLEEESEKEIYILATHRHCDHVAGVAEVRDFCGGRVVISALDECGLKSTVHSLGDMLGLSHKLCDADITVNDGDVLRLGDMSVEVLLTPGHTCGSVCYVVDDFIFSGDTLFCESIGRTDFPTGNAYQMQTSLNRLFSLSGDYKVYPGHGEATSLRYEEQNNPYYYREF